MKEISANDILDWNKGYGRSFRYQKHHGQSYDNTMFNEFESRILYSLICGMGINKIVEFSPCKGFSSSVMIDALDARKSFNIPSQVLAEIHSYDLVEDSAQIDRDRDFISRKLTVGDVKKTLDPKLVSECDLLFIDSDHTAPFAEWYMREIVPMVRPDVPIWVHDWECTFRESEEAKVVIKRGFKTGMLRPIFNCMDYQHAVGVRHIVKLEHRDWKYSRSPSQILIRT